MLLQFATACAALDALPEWTQREGLHLIPQSVPKPSFDLAALGGQALHIGATDYPELLAVAEDAPNILMSLGDGSLLKLPTAAIINTRNASANGRTLTTTFVDKLSGTEYVILSEMSHGIFTLSHIRALNGSTIAAAAGSVDVIYLPL